MAYTKRAIAVTAFCTALLSLSGGILNARDGSFATDRFAAAQSAKQQCLSACRARYRDCRRANQFPGFDCKSVYQDCTRYSCTGAGPG